MQFRFRCAAVLTAVLLCSAAALPALAEETATPETADSVAGASTYTGWKTVNGKDYWYENGVKQDLGLGRLLPQEPPRRAADAHRTRRVAAGRPRHDRAEHIK